MKYYDLKHQLESQVVFSANDIFLVDPTFRQPTLYDWEKAGKVIKLKNNAYIFPDFEPTDNDFYLISNLLYEPSYVSLEQALSHYGIIPELVQTVAGVTTNKTKTFKTPVGNFSYQTVKPELYFGYDLLEVRDHGVKIASLEKTILDFLYLNSQINTVEDFSELRWNVAIIKSTLNQNIFEDYLTVFNSSALRQRTELLLTFLE